MKKLHLIFTALLFLAVSALHAQMVLEYDIIDPNTQISLPLAGTVNVSVDWGDGSTENFTTAGDKPHTYTTTGIKIVTITGTLTAYGSTSASNARLIKVTQWDNLGITSFNRAFQNATNLIEVPQSLPGTVVNLSLMFFGCSNFNFDISGWNTANVTNMISMFSGASSFNQAIGDWNTANVTIMSGMFREVSSFNQPIGGWNTANVTSMNSMFQNTSSFNQPIGNWNTANVTNMNAMFWGARSFNQPIGGWNVEKVTNMTYMFSHVQLCTENYDHLLNGWASQAVQNNRTFDGGSSKYSDASAAARASLVSRGWNITDGGLDADGSGFCEMATAPLAWESVTVPCTQTSFQQVINSTNAFPANVIAIDFDITYDPAVLNPTGATPLVGATEYASINFTKPSSGRARISLYLNQAPQGVALAIDQALLQINWSIVANATPDVPHTISMENVLVSYPVGYDNMVAPEPVAFTYQSEYRIRITTRVPGSQRRLIYDSSNPDLYLPTFVTGLNADCEEETDVLYPSMSAMVVIPAAGVSHLSLSRDIVGDQSVAKENCTIVNNVINTSDVNRVLQIVNGSVTASPLELLSADVNLDGIVSSADAALISSRAINEYGCEFPQVHNYNEDGTPNESYEPSKDWLFVAQSVSDNYSFDRMSVPMVAECQPVPNELCETNPALYYGIMLGDVNASWNNTHAQSGMRTAMATSHQVFFDLLHVDTTETGTYLIPVLVQSDADYLFGVDMSIELDNLPMEIVTIVPVEGISTRFNHMKSLLLLQTFEYEGLTDGSILFYIEVVSIPSSLEKGITAYVNGEPSALRTASSINDNLFNEATIYPNPTNGELRINWSVYSNETIQIRVMDISGREMFSGSKELVNSLWTSVDVSSLRSGAYILQVMSQSGNKYWSFIKE